MRNHRSQALHLHAIAWKGVDAGTWGVGAGAGGIRGRMPRLIRFYDDPAASKCTHVIC